MEKFTSLKNGVLRLPPGFRFYPTDEELVLQYLIKRALSSPLPAAVIPDADVCRFDPWDLPGLVSIFFLFFCFIYFEIRGGFSVDGFCEFFGGSGDLERERYFFSTREAKYSNGRRSNRATGSGYWKATGIDRKIVSTKENRLIGFKKTLVFYTGKPPNGLRTDWVMHEYRLVGSSEAPPSSFNDGLELPTLVSFNFLKSCCFLNENYLNWKSIWNLNWIELSWFFCVYVWYRIQTGFYVAYF